MNCPAGHKGAIPFMRKAQIICSTRASGIRSFSPLASLAVKSDTFAPQARNRGNGGDGAPAGAGMIARAYALRVEIGYVRAAGAKQGERGPSASRFSRKAPQKPSRGGLFADRQPLQFAISASQLANKSNCLIGESKPSPHAFRRAFSQKARRRRLSYFFGTIFSSGM